MTCLITFTCRVSLVIYWTHFVSGLQWFGEPRSFRQAVRDVHWEILPQATIHLAWLCLQIHQRLLWTSHEITHHFPARGISICRNLRCFSSQSYLKSDNYNLATAQERCCPFDVVSSIELGLLGSRLRKKVGGMVVRATLQAFFSLK